MKPIIVIFTIGLILRILVCLPIFSNINLGYKNDTPSFKNIALNLAAGNGYSACNDYPYYYDSIRTPIYPVFLSIFYKFNISEKFLILLQILMSASIIIIVYKTALIIGDNNTANWSAAFVAFNSHLLAYSGYILSEVLFTVLLTFAFFLVIKKGRSFFKTMMSTFLYGAALLTQPILFYLTPIFFITIFIYNNLFTALISLSIILSISLLWMANLNNKTDHFTLSSLQAYNTYATYGNIVNCYENGFTEEISRKILIAKLTHNPFSDCNGNYEYIDEMSSKGKTLIFNNLGLYIINIPSYVIHSLLPDVSEISRIWGWFKPGQGTLSVLNSEGLIKGIKHFLNNSSKGLFILLPFILFWAFTILCFLKAVWQKKKDKSILILFLFIVAYIILPGPAASPRFTLCVLPLISIIAGIVFTRKVSPNNLTLPPTQ